MKLGDRIKADKQTFKRLSSKRKCLFIWDYYRIPIIAFVLISAVLTMILTGVGNPQASLYVVMVNSNMAMEGEAACKLLKDSGVDFAEREIDIETGYTLEHDDITEADVQTVEVLAVRFGIGDLDVFVADEAIFKAYAQKDAFIDLRLFMSQEELETCKADLYCYENTHGKEITGGLWLREGSPLHKAGLYHGDILIGVASLAENLDNALHFVFKLAEREAAESTLAE